MLEDREYKFTDEQVRALGFTSYEELEKYYDILYVNMKGQQWTKQVCHNQLVIMGLDHRLDLPRRDRLICTLEDRIGIITSWNDTNWIPTQEEIRSEKDAVLQALDIYCSFSKKQCVIDLENSEKTPHHR